MTASHPGPRGRIRVWEAEGLPRKGYGVSIFAWCAIIGCAILLAGILLDGVLDAFLPDGLVPVLALPVAVFGAIGMGMTAVSGSAATQAIGSASGSLTVQEGGSSSGSATARGQAHAHAPLRRTHAVTPPRLTCGLL